MTCEHPQNTPSTAYGKGCRCERCVTNSRERNRKFNAARIERTAERKLATATKNLLERPGCQFPQNTALSAYQRGCRCMGCVQARRAMARRSQAAAYAKNPRKFIERQQAYLARKKEKVQNG